MTIGLGGEDKAVETGRGFSAVDGVREEPVIAPDNKGADSPLGGIIIDRQTTVLDITH